MINNQAISSVTLLNDNADGLYMAVFSTSGDCVFLGDYRDNPIECGVDFASIDCGEAVLEDVLDWTEGNWLDLICASHEGMSRTQVRNAILRGDTKHGFPAWKLNKAYSLNDPPKHEDFITPDNVKTALQAAGRAVSYAAWRVQNKAQEIASQAVGRIDRAMQNGMEEPCAQIKAFYDMCDLLRAWADDDIFHPCQPMDAHHVAEAFTLLKLAVFGSDGGFHAHFYQGKPNSWDDEQETACAPAVANKIELSVSGVSRHLPFKGDFTKAAEDLARNTALMLARACKLGPYQDHTRNGDRETFIFQI